MTLSAVVPRCPDDGTPLDFGQWERMTLTLAVPGEATFTHLCPHGVFELSTGQPQPTHRVHVRVQGTIIRKVWTERIVPPPLASVPWSGVSPAPTVVPRRLVIRKRT